MKLLNLDIYQKILFFLCVGVTYLNNYELTFMVWFIAFLITIKKKYSLNIFYYVSIFSTILIISFFSSFFYNPTIFSIIRDITYLTKPILGLLIGYQIFKLNNTSKINYFIKVGFFIALIHILILFIAFLQVKSLDLNILRSWGGYFSDYEIYVLIILLFHKEFNVTLSKKAIRLIFTTVFISSLLYASRTNLIQFVILLLAMKGYFKITKKSLYVLISIFSIMTLSYFLIVSYNPIRGGKGLDAFLYKIKIAPEEAFKTKINKEDWKDFNDNYRSFENIITVKQVSNEGLIAILFGKGLGSNVNLGRKVQTNDGTEVQFIPILHNGFMTVFLKAGLFGVFFLVYFIYILSKQDKSKKEIINNINYLLVGTSIFLIVSNWVFMGLYLKLDNKSIIIGFLIALKELMANQSKELIE